MTRNSIPMMKSSAPTTPPAVTAVTAVSLSGQESTFLSSVYYRHTAEHIYNWNTWCSSTAGWVHDFNLRCITGNSTAGNSLARNFTTDCSGGDFNKGTA